MIMYKLRLKRSFVAQHYLTVPDCGPENEWHSHAYALELVLRGHELDKHGYLVDIDHVKAEIDVILKRFRDATLNDDPDFAGLNPSVEHFARIVCQYLRDTLKRSNLDYLTVKIWEDEEAWASFETEL